MRKDPKLQSIIRSKKWKWVKTYKIHFIMYKIDEGSCSIGRPKGRLNSKDGEPQPKKISKIGGFAVIGLFHHILFLYYTF